MTWQEFLGEGNLYSASKGKQTAHSDKSDLATELCKETLKNPRKKSPETHIRSMRSIEWRSTPDNPAEKPTRPRDNLNGRTAQTDNHHDSFKSRNLPVKRANGSVE